MCFCVRCLLLFLFVFQLFVVCCFSLTQFPSVKWLFIPGKGACIFCPAGFFAPTTGLSACVPCGANNACFLGYPFAKKKTALSLGLVQQTINSFPMETDVANAQLLRITIVLLSLAGVGAFIFIAGGAYLFYSGKQPERFAGLERVDFLFSKAHQFDVGEPLRYYPTPLGGAFTIGTVTVMLFLSVVLALQNTYVPPQLTEIKTSSLPFAARGSFRLQVRRGYRIFSCSWILFVSIHRNLPCLCYKFAWICLLSVDMTSTVTFCFSSSIVAWVLFMFEIVQVIIYGNGLAAACSSITLLPAAADTWVGSNVSIANIYSASDFSCTAVWSCPDCSLAPSSGSPYFVLLSSTPSWANYYNVSFQTPSLMTDDPTIPDPGAIYASSVLMLPSSNMNALTGFRSGGADGTSKTADGTNPSIVFNLTPFIVYTGAASAPITRVTLQPSVYSVSASGPQGVSQVLNAKEGESVKPQVMATTSPTSLVNGYGFKLDIMLQTNTITIVTYDMIMMRWMEFSLISLRMPLCSFIK